MIKSDAQRERTVAQIEGFQQALAKVGEGDSYLERLDEMGREVRGRLSRRAASREGGAFWRAMASAVAGAVLFPRAHPPRPGSSSRRSCSRSAVSAWPSAGTGAAGDGAEHRPQGWAE